MASKAIVAILTIFALGFLAPAASGLSLRQAETDPSAPAPINGTNNSTDDEGAYIVLSLNITLVIPDISDDLRDAFNAIKGNITHLKNITDAFGKQVASDLSSGLKNETEKFKSWLNKTKQALKEATTELTTELKQNLTNALQTIEDNLDQIKDNLQNKIDEVKANLEKLLALEKEQVKNTKDALVGALNNTITTAKSILLGLGQATAASAQALRNKIQQGLLNSTIAQLVAQADAKNVTIKDLVQALANNGSQEATDLLNKLKLDIVGKFDKIFANQTQVGSLNATQLAEEIGQALNATKQAVLQATAQIAASLKDNLGAALKDVVNGLVLGLGDLKNVVGALLGGLGGIVGAVAGLVGVLVGGLGAVVGGLLGAVGGLLTGLGGLIGGGAAAGIIL